MKKTVVIGFVGTQLDNGGKGLGRWEKWRPSVALCQHEDLLVHRFELLYSAPHQGLVDQLSSGYSSGLTRNRAATGAAGPPRSMGF